MKVLTLLLSFLLLAMVIMPCQEDSKSEKDGIELTSQSKADKHDAPEDNCQAFCQCARCPFSVTYPSTDQHIAERSLFFTSGADAILAIRNVSFAVWQPPRSLG